MVKRLLISFALAVLLSLPLWAGGQPPAAPTAQPTGPMGKFNESPMLTARVNTGELPAIDERLPDVPFVMPVQEEIGKYGGQLTVFHENPTTWEDFGRLPAGGGKLLFLGEDGVVSGFITKDWTMADDYTSITLYLREGMKWSDGELFTTDDIIFAWYDLNWNENVTYWGAGFPLKEGGVVKIDNYTVRYDFTRPAPTTPLLMCGPAGGDWSGYQPKHYLQHWHIDYNPDAQKIAKEEGFAEWYEALQNHFFWMPINDIEKPTLMPWITTEMTTSFKAYERNPYFFAVDPAGNQLPYIDSILAQIIDPEVYHLKIISGEADIAFTHATFENYTLYKENEAAGNYKVYNIAGLTGSELGFFPNLNIEDPLKNGLFNDKRFRIALSLAINRDEMNNLFLAGMAVPRAGTMNPDTSYYKEEWGNAYIQYDPAQSNKLLDEVGLTKKDADGFRLTPDGKPLIFVVEFGGLAGNLSSKAIELVKEYWEAVGLKIAMKESPFGSLMDRVGANLVEIRADGVDLTTEFRPGSDAGPFNLGKNAGLWGSWMGAKVRIDRGEATLEDFPDGTMPGLEAPQYMQELRSWIEERNNYPIGSKEWNELSTKIFDFHAENLFIIGTVGLAPQPYIAKNYLGNIPKRYNPFGTWPGDLNEYNMQIYFKEPR